MSVADYINSLSQGFWAKPWHWVPGSDTNGLIEFRELPDKILWVLPCCLSVIEPHTPGCQAVEAIRQWGSNDEED